MHPKRWCSKRVGRLTPRVGPESRRHGTQSKGRAYGAAGAVRARAKRGRSARAQAGAGGRGGAPQERPPRRLRLQTGVRLLLRPFYLGVAAEKEFLVSKHCKYIL